MYDYNIINECKNIEIINQENPLIKVIHYNTLSFDCDSSKYCKNIYKKIWNYKPVKGNFGTITMNNQEMIVGMDTMNSFFTTWGWFFNNHYQDILKDVFKCEKFNRIKVEDIINNIDLIENVIINRHGNELLNNIKRFATYSHTIGNMILVPKELPPYTKGKGTFNTMRATKVKDFWDLSMELLKNENFPFNDYCDMFYLKNIYTDNNYNIIKFINHDVDNALPKSIEEYNLFLQIVVDKIIERGKIIDFLLNKKQEE